MASMTSYERILKTFRFEKTDKVPVYHLGMSSSVASRVLGREAYVGGGVQQWREASMLWRGGDAHAEFLERSMGDAFDISDAMNMDIIRAEYWRLPEKPHKKLDEYTYVYGGDDSWQIRRYNPKTEVFDVTERSLPPSKASFADLEVQLDAREKAAESYNPKASFKAAEQALARTDGKKAVRVNAGHMDIPLDHTWMEAVCLAPELVERHLRLQADKAIKDISYLATVKNARFIWGGSDIAGKTGPFFSPDAFRRFFLPELRRVTKCCADNGMYLVFTSDGNLWDLAEDLFGGSGISGYGEVDRSAGMDMDALRGRYPKLSLVGNISSATVHLAGPPEIEREVVSCMEAAKRHGGIIVGCSNYFMNETPTENIFALIDAIEKYR